MEPVNVDATAEQDKDVFIARVVKRERSDPPTLPVDIDLVDERPVDIDLVSDEEELDNGREMVVDFGDEDEMDMDDGDHDLHDGIEGAEFDDMEDDEQEEEEEVSSPRCVQVWPPLAQKTPSAPRKTSMSGGSKLARQNSRPRQLSWTEQPANPDLNDYFSQWPAMKDFTKIALCRTYANYLAQKMRTESSLNGGSADGGAKKRTKK